MDKHWYYEQVRARRGMTSKIISSTIPGTFIIEATIEFMPVAIGTVWFTWYGNKALETLQSYVHHQFRRLGVRTWLHEELIKAYPVVEKFVTLGTTPCSKPWLKKMGYKKDEFEDWILILEKKKKLRKLKT